jgi:hypothetical protein
MTDNVFTTRDQLPTMVDPPFDEPNFLTPDNNSEISPRTRTEIMTNQATPVAEMV